MQLWLTGAITSATTWNNQPAWHTRLHTISDAKGYNSSCPAGNLAFNTTAGVKESHANGWATLTLGLRASSESDVFAWKKFDANSAVLSTTYYTRPNAPTRLDTSPVSTNNQHGCGDKAPYQFIGNVDSFYLQARVAGPDGGTVKARIRIWPTGHQNGGDGVIVDKTVTVTSGSIARVKINKSDLLPHLGTANGNFSWKARAGHSQANLWSDWTPTSGAPGCRFVFDPNRPSKPPAVTSNQFPDGSDGWPEGTAPARAEGTFVISSGGVGDVAAYEWWTSSNTTRRKAAPSSLRGSVSVKYQPLSTGPHRFYAQSIDRAGNRSDTRTYLFYAASRGVTDKPGDLNGDGFADFYGQQNGKDYLNFSSGLGDGRVNNWPAASARVFDDALITHRGDWSGQGYEDLIAAHPMPDGTRRLTVHPNDGLGYACTEQGETGFSDSQGCEREAFDLLLFEEENNHWSGADQILAIGDVDGGLDTNGDGVRDVEGHPDLLVREGDLLWLYFGDTSGFLDHQEPVLIGGASWGQHDLIAPGDASGNGHVDLITRDRGDGRLYFHEGTGNPDGNGPLFGSPTIMGTGFTPEVYPQITSGTDANGDGRADLWATHSEGLVFFSGIGKTSTGTRSFVRNQVGVWLTFRQLA